LPTASLPVTWPSSSVILPGMGALPDGTPRRRRWRTNLPGVASGSPPRRWAAVSPRPPFFSYGAPSSATPLGR
jgi:hypothetical protein